MKRKPKFVSICNQKGGIGKSTFTVLMASELHYRLGRSVLVVDCDYPQWSVARQRERELSYLRDDDAGKRAVIRQFRASGRKMWPVLESRPADAVADVRRFLDEDDREFDYVLFDLPGTLATGGVLRLVSSIEHLFIPVKADRMVLESAITFARMVCETFVASERIATQSVHLFWTMIDHRERTALLDRYDALFGEFGLPCLGTRIPRRARFSHEAAPEGGAPFRSTLLPADAALARDARTDALAREILSILER